MSGMPSRVQTDAERRRREARVEQSMKIRSRSCIGRTMDFRPREAPFFWRLLLQIWPDRFQIFAHFISAQAPISVNMVC